MLNPVLSVIIPASNEEGYIGACLIGLFGSTPIDGGAEAIVVANGCRDGTARAARDMAALAKAAGWHLVVLDLAQGGKPNALNAGDGAACGKIRAYLDADVIVSAELMAGLVTALSADSPRYATGTAHIPPASSFVTRAYGRFWQRLPFARSNAPGYGLFAVNSAGRARWGEFPAIISDDTFVRLQFAASERIQIAERYDWPMIEGFTALTRVRRRQNAGVAEIDRLYSGLLDREEKPRLSALDLAGLALRDPVGFAIYAAVSLAVKLGRTKSWTRGR